MSVPMPSYDALTRARAALVVYARTMAPDDPFRLALEHVDAWIQQEAQHAFDREVAVKLDAEDRALGAL